MVRFRFGCCDFFDLSCGLAALCRSFEVLRFEDLVKLEYNARMMKRMWNGQHDDTYEGANTPFLGFLLRRRRIGGRTRPGLRHRTIFGTLSRRYPRRPSPRTPLLRCLAYRVGGWWFFLVVPGMHCSVRLFGTHS